MRRDRTTRPRGAAAVEFAIVLPVLIAILCGTIDWGYYFFAREILVHASREGARAGTLSYNPPTTARAEAEKAAKDYIAGTLDPAAAVITTNVNAGGGACPPTSSCIRITYTLGRSLTGFTGTFVPDSIVAYSEMRK